MKLFTTDTLKTLADMLKWPCQDGQYQLAGWIEMYRYATWLGYDVSEHIDEYEAQCKAIKHEFWEFPHCTLAEHRATLHLLDSMPGTFGHRDRFEATYALVYAKLAAPIDALQDKAIVIDDDKLGIVIGNKVQILRSKVPCGVKPSETMYLPTNPAEYRLATAEDFDQYRIHLHPDWIA
jgi:hypothetical protein